jgi:hypothetical protein
MRAYLTALLLITCSLCRAQQALPHFSTAASARAWAEARERAGQYQLAGEAYLREADLRQATGDPQAAEVERRRAHRLLTDLALAIPVPFHAAKTHLARLEPANGCYLGVLDQYPDGQLGNADDFAERLGRSVGVAFNYSAYGEPFPEGWARAQAARGRLIQIAWEPERGLGQVRDNAYLNQWAADAARCGTGVFLRFAGEMNGDWTAWGRSPAAYKRAFRLVHDVIDRHASNVAMVWAPNDVPVAGVDAYYPGDDVVDWVGISLYIVRFYDDNRLRPAWQDNPIGYIAPFYDRYAARKPFCLVECGVTRRSRVEGIDADPFAAIRIEDLMDAIRVRFPRLKMLCWFDRNNLSGAVPGRRLNDYSLPRGSLALAALQTAAADPYFLGASDETAPLAYRRVTTRLPRGYVGEMIGSLSTYTLNARLTVARDAATHTVTRPLRFFVPHGAGPLTVRVVDPHGHFPETIHLAAP